MFILGLATLILILVQRQPAGVSPGAVGSTTVVTLVGAFTGLVSAIAGLITAVAGLMTVMKAKRLAEKER